MEVEGWSGLSEDLKQELRTLLAASATAINPSLLLRHRHADPSYMRCQEVTLGEREVGEDTCTHKPGVAEQVQQTWQLPDQ